MDNKSSRYSSVCMPNSTCTIGRDGRISNTYILSSLFPWEGLFTNSWLDKTIPFKTLRCKKTEQDFSKDEMIMLRVSSTRKVKNSSPRFGMTICVLSSGIFCYSEEERFLAALEMTYFCYPGAKRGGSGYTSFFHTLSRQGFAGIGDDGGGIIVDYPHQSLPF
uniref:Uncharacterized protein n=1 Tax=Candidatus Kentrum sp. MB TaxID=2138164 RepID=A0A450XAP4_9GAMM|nr:MAG: hypothetical protein BECKMB1821G_GA0114241_101942 [Candidatus Kentron sp. MB]VFK30781.1 MAG: hypothetical protein BECKMB1821I_GA0114274_10189 [Candidatus Kentron sp. MB]VFK75230.1 MAG: hypothetical protein BECKMB1821H_GA0114242_10189 [Candidatus Kentron sp. MB]